MPLVVCPKCSCNLKVPDGSLAAVRCPKCQTVFQPAVPSHPAFEVVDDGLPVIPPEMETPPGGPVQPNRSASRPAPPPPARPAPSAPRPAPRQEAAPGFEVVDDEDAAPLAPKRPAPIRDEDGHRSPSRRSRDDDDYDPPRRRRREDEDDYDDRPRRRRSRDDDDYDDRPRRRGRYRDDDDYDRPPDRRAPFRRAKIGTLLLSISLWLYLSALGVTTLFFIVVWLGGDPPVGLILIPGLAGLGNWLLAAIGLGFCIAGPAKGRGLAIAAVSVAAVHLILTFVCFAKVQDGFNGRGVIGFGGTSYFGWALFISTLPALDLFIPMLIYNSRGFGEFIVVVLAGACEAARLILVLLSLQAAARAARDYEAAERGKLGVMVSSFVMGGVAVVVLIVVVIIAESKFTSIRTVANIGLGTVVLVYLAYTLMALPCALAANETRSACDRRS